MNPNPSVLAFLICEKVIEEARTSKKTFVGVFGQILAPTAPAIMPFGVYARPTDAEGDYIFRINISSLQGDQEHVIVQLATDAQTVQSRLAVVELALNLPPILFPAFGRYEMQLYANDVFITHATVDVLQVGGQ
jgi:hypothetical protein